MVSFGAAVIIQQFIDRWPTKDGDDDKENEK
jgi:hypothetical protein